MEIAAGLLIIFGLIGSFLPFLPGPPLSFAGLFIYAYITGFSKAGAVPLVIFGILTLASILLDFFAPVLTTKKNKASKYGNYGVIVGSVLGIGIGGLFGVLIGALVGGFIGEYIATKNVDTSLQIMKGVFVGFLLGSIFRIFVSLAIVIYYVYMLLI